jgi:hypothetical protein
MLSVYHAIMDSNSNPLRALPPVQRFQTMLYLSIMWTTIFCAAAGAWFLLRGDRFRALAYCPGIPGDRSDISYGGASCGTAATERALRSIADGSVR